MEDPNAENHLPVKDYENNLYYGIFYEKEDVVYAMNEYAKEYAKRCLDEYKLRLKDEINSVMDNYYTY